MSIIPSRIRILYVMMGILLLVSAVPMYFYADRVVAVNRDRLKVNEMLIQNTITRSLSEDLAQRQVTLGMMLENLGSAAQVASGGNFTGEHIAAPELRALLEKFVSSYPDLAYATLLNTDAKGISAGKIAPDAFLRRELEYAFAAARDGRAYTGQPLTLGAGKDSHAVVLVSHPLIAGGRFIGMVGGVVDLRFIVQRLRELGTGGLQVYVVDQHGRLVAGASQEFAVGQDMSRFDIVKKFAEHGARGRLIETTEFTTRVDKTEVDMLGTYSPVPALEWAVIAQKEQREAYAGVYEMQRYSRLLETLAVLLSLLISLYAAKRITTPLQTLTESSRAIARGDFSQRVRLKSRTEFGELAETFNTMTGELEQFVLDLKRAAEQNRELFLNSIQMLAGAVDEKDPYTRGHSDRVTRYSILLAEKLGLEEQAVENIRVAAQLHDVGKIGIEDRILKKPGSLTQEEFEIMKTHTTRGANLLRRVESLRDMIPGIELHHESLDGRGYPHGLRGDQIPLMARIISVADTYDAMTTNRPYQDGREPAQVVKIIQSLADTRYDSRVIAALVSVFEEGKLTGARADSEILLSAAVGASDASLAPPNPQILA